MRSGAIPDLIAMKGDKIMSIYLSNSYLNIEKILSYKVPFNFVIGGRGTGKTYGALKYVLEHDSRIMLMRRTQAQCDLVNKPEFNPFKKLATDLKLDISVKSISKYNSMLLQNFADEDFKIIGYTCALSTIANMRGFDASDVNLLIYDEFIPEKHERTIKNEGSAFLNAYETINRNRELEGREPLQALCLANAFDIANAIFLELGLVGIAERMKKKEQEIYVNRDTGVLIALLDESKISQKKKQTALYKLASGSYSEMALTNDFAYNDDSNVQSKNLKEFKLLCTIGEISIYKHKSRREYYVSEHRSGSGDKFNSDEVGLLKYRKKYGLTMYSAYLKGLVIFENILTKSLFELYTI